MSLGTQKDGAALLFCLLLAACTGDRTGVQPVVDLPVVWSLSEHPVIEIGGDSAGAYAFGRITGVSQDQEERIRVLDGMTAEVRLFRADGTHVDTWNWRKKAVGEYGAARLLGTIREDSLIILDPEDGVVGALSPRGRPGWLSPILSSGGRLAKQALAVVADGRLVVQDLRDSGGPTVKDGEILSDTIRLFLLDPHSDSIGELGRAAAPMWVWTHGERVPMPFSPRLSVATRGETTFTLGPAGSTVIVYGPAGGHAVWQSPRTPEGVTRSDHVAYRQSVNGRGMKPSVAEAWTAALDHDGLPEFKPIYDRVVATDDGELWARRVRSEAPTHEWDVFARDGTVRGIVRTPSEFLVQQVTAHHVLGIARDSLGVQIVYLFQKNAEADSADITLALSEMRAELESLSELQEIYVADYRTYSSSVDSLLHSLPVKHPDVLIDIKSSSSSGWAAVASHRRLAPQEGCAVFAGDPPSRPFVPVEPKASGLIACTR